MRDIHEFLSHFQGVNGNHPQYRATCPVCQKENHLYIKDADGMKAVVYCQKCGASFAEIMTSAGLRPQDAFFEEEASFMDDAVHKREHIYTTETGETFAKKVIVSKSDGKKNCFWNVWNGNGWTTGLCGKTAPLYNYAELSHTSGTVYFAEGEKDAETLSRMGYTATTGANGANGTKWSDEYTEVLKGRDIVILTDNDDKGEKYGEFIADHVVDTAASVKIVPAVRIMPTIKVKGDITDVVETIGETDAKEALERAISMIPAYVRPVPKDIFDELGFYNVEDLSEEERKPPEFIVEGLIPVGMSFLVGAPKRGKSFLSMQMALDVANGTQFLGHNTKKVSVVYFDLEGSKSRTDARLRGMRRTQPRNLYITHSNTLTLANGLLNAIDKITDTHTDVRLVIVDTYSVARGNIKATGSNAYDADVQLLSPVHQMAVQKNIAILFVHHDKKGASVVSDTLERGSGTMGIVGSADSVINLIGDAKRTEGRVKMEYSPRDAKGGEIDLKFDENCLTWKAIGAEEQRQSLENNPFCKWCIDHVPDDGNAGLFVDYKTIYREATGNSVENPGKEIHDSILSYIDELKKLYRIGLQFTRMKDKRGLRIIKIY